MYNTQRIHDVLGVGIGPFNLSLAALLSTVKSLDSCFFDQSDAFVWHPGLLLPNAEIQVSYLKDLVTLADPTNPYSFIAYLSKHKRLYRFINSHFQHVLRREFNLYLQWVSRKLPNLMFQQRVEEITFADNAFVMRTQCQMKRGRHIVLGNGLTPTVPACASLLMGKQVFHSKDFLFHAEQLAAKRIVVIGGGQSGAEIIHYLLGQDAKMPSQITWVTQRQQFAPMDDSTFANEFFMPPYIEYFNALPAEKRQRLLAQQVLASDGISASLLEQIYQRLYTLEFLEARADLFKLYPHFKLADIVKTTEGYEILIAEKSGQRQQLIQADIIILATGYHWEMPKYLAPIAARIPLENGRFKVNADFSIQWEGPKQHRIYIQNGARHTHGVADPNLSLMAWRSAKIINSIAEHAIYDIDNESTVFDWAAAITQPTIAWKHVVNA